MKVFYLDAKILLVEFIEIRGQVRQTEQILRQVKLRILHPGKESYRRTKTRSGLVAAPKQETLRETK